MSEKTGYTESLVESVKESGGTREPVPAVLAGFSQRLWEVLPAVVRTSLIRYAGRYPTLGKELEEIRLRAGRISSLIFRGTCLPVDMAVSGEDLRRLLRALCGGSVYAHETALRQGAVGFYGGIRVGIAGRAVYRSSEPDGVSEVDALILRLPRRVPGAGEGVLRAYDSPERGEGGILVLSPPGVGKTTALREFAEVVSSAPRWKRTVVIDTRGELSAFPDREAGMEILSGYDASAGVSMALRALNPQILLCDEVGAGELAVLTAARRSGVCTVASAHAKNLRELLCRPEFAEAHRTGLFGAYVELARPAGQPMQSRIEFSFCGEASACGCGS